VTPEPRGATIGVSEPGPRPATPLADVETVYFDLDGCVWFGDQLADGAIALVDALRASGRRVGFLTNTSNADPEQVATKLRRLGIAATVDDLIMPIEVLAAHPWLRDRPRVWFLGPPQLRRAGAELTPIATTPAEAELLVLGRDPAMTYADLAEALQVLTRGGRLLALNVDPRLPVEGGRMLPGTGEIAAALTYASGVVPEVVGKPAPVFFETALRRFGASAERAVIVGDTLDADIAGGQGVGMRTVLVGGATPSSRNPAPVPDHHVRTLADVGCLFGL
jgi:HAD superfamily hydrolase (TIGR01450 family)